MGRRSRHHAAEGRSIFDPKWKKVVCNTKIVYCVLRIQTLPFSSEDNVFSTSRSRVKQGEDYYWKHRPCSRTGSTPRCTRYFYAKGRCFQSHLREARHVTFFRSADKTQRADATIATILTKKHRAVVVRMCFVSIHIFKLQRACASDN